MEYIIEFERLNWQVPFKGIRHKFLDQDNIRARLVEYDRSMPAHWCEKSHYGIVIEGVFEIQFDQKTIRYHKGDGLFLPAGCEHRHRGKSITPKTLIFFIETPIK